MRRWGIVIWWIVGCGPSVSTGSGGGEGEGATGSTLSTSSASSSTSTSSTTTAMMSTTSSGSVLSSTSADDIGVGAECDDVPYPEPPTPPGCSALALVDEKGAEIPGSYSGLVQCPEPGAPEASVYSIFRTGKVQCPFNTGQCLCDADCAPTEQCVCDFFGKPSWATPGNECLPADCSSEMDCGGQRCRAAVLFCGTYDLPTEFHCTSPEDDCDTHTTCINLGEQYCEYDGGDEIFTCSPGAVCE